MLRYTPDGNIWLSSEVDGLFIFGEDKLEFLQKVREPTEEIFQIGSTKPSALLYDAWNHFEVYQAILSFADVNYLEK